MKNDAIQRRNILKLQSVKAKYVYNKYLKRHLIHLFLIIYPNKQDMEAFVKQVFVSSCSQQSLVFLLVYENPQLV